ncbi:MAG: aminoglycoside 6-adenylyltransferase [Clostridiales bacterium]|nr:aminoglycoside 6-adenylyltransferase [Clostridiales bacterium]
MQQALLDAITRFAETSDEVIALILIGSQARADRKADAFSDIDLIMVVKDAKPFIRSDSWLNEIGGFHISFTEPTVDGQTERRVLFDGAQDVDFVIMDEDAAMLALRQGDAAGILGQGYRVLVDKRRVALPERAPGTAFAPAAEAEFLNTVHDFWYHTVWTAKKLLRGELWAAKFCADGYMKWKLLWMIQQHERAVRKTGGDTWYAGRFIDFWAADDIRSDLKNTFAHYDRADIAAALQETTKLFRRLAREVAQAQGFAYPSHADDYATAWVLEQLESLSAKKGGSL